jgi:L-rhamnose mutarotase
MAGAVQRFGSVVKVRPDKLEEYRRLHAAVWPTVLATLTACHVSNYSIFYRDGLLFSYMEYDGEDWAADSARMAADPETQRWWTYTDPCQQPVDSAAPGELWAPMESLFFMA